MSREAWVAWWQGLDQEVKDRWAPVLKRMTPAEVSEFHDFRTTRRESFAWPEDTAAGLNERDAAERLLLGHWRQRVEGRGS